MKFWYILLVSFLIITNFVAIYYLDQHIDRWFRFGATLILSLYFITKFLKGYKLLIVFLLMTLCDGFLVFYEIPFFKNAIYLTRIIAYLFLILQVAPMLKNLKINLGTIVIAAFTLFLDVYLLDEMADSLPAQDKNLTFLILFYSLGIISLAFVAVSLSFLFRFSSKKALLLVIVSLGFVLSDIFYYNAYYLDFEEFYYLDRLCNICGIGALFLFSREVMNQPQEDFLAPRHI